MDAAGGCMGLHADTSVLTDLDVERLANQLLLLIKGHVLRSKDATFKEAVTLFNAAAPVNVRIVARPADAQDVSIIIKFCRDEGLSPSVKAGGFSTAGWATQGNLLIDLSLMNDVALLSPDSTHSSIVVNADSVASISQTASGPTRRRTADEAFDTSFSSSESRHFSQSSDNGRSLFPNGKRAAILRMNKDEGPERRQHAVGTVGAVSFHESSDRTDTALSSTSAATTILQSSTSAPKLQREPLSSNVVAQLSQSSTDGADGDPRLRAESVQNGFGSHFDPMRNNISSLWPNSIVTESSSADHASSRSSGVGLDGNIPSSHASSSSFPCGIHAQKYALASFGPGATVRCIDSYLHKAGLDGCVTKGKARSSTIESSDVLIAAVPYHVPSSAYPVGSGSIYTGGLGYLSRAYSLSVDNIVEIEIVLADGRIVVLSDDAAAQSQELADLWWAVRGAAPAFGIVTRTLARAYPVPTIFSANLVLPFSKSTAGSLIRHWRDVLKSSKNELYANLILTAGPDNTSHVVVIQMSYLGSAQDGEAFVSALSSWNGERMLLKDTCVKSFLMQQDSVAQVLKEGPGRRWKIRGDLLDNLSDTLINKTVELFCGNGTRKVWLFELAGGAIASPSLAAASCINPAARQARFAVAALQQWAEKDEDNTCIASVDRWMEDVVMPESACGGPLPCFLERDEPDSRVRGSFGEANYARLCEIKARVDPQGLFRHSFANGFIDARVRSNSDPLVRKASTDLLGEGQ